MWGRVAALVVVIGVWGLVRSDGRTLVGPVTIVAIAGTVLFRNLGLLADGDPTETTRSPNRRRS